MIRFLLILIVVCFANTCIELRAQCGNRAPRIRAAAKERVERARQRTRTAVRTVLRR